MSAIPSFTQTARSSAQGPEVIVSDRSPQVASVALLVASAVLGSMLFGPVGALVAPLIGIWVLALVTDDTCLDRDIKKVYTKTDKPSPQSETSFTHEATSL